MNIHIEHLTVNVSIQPHEPVPEVQPIRRGHRTPEETQARQLRLALIEAQQAMQKSAERIQRRLRVAEKLRVMFGDDLANQHLAGVL
jgi:hypothetical protein